jgi:hypothetical protein
MSIRQSIVIPFAVVALALACPASVASAGTGLSQLLCNGNQPSTFSTPLTIVDGSPASYGFRGPTFAGPGVPIRDGDVLRVHASGSIKIDSWPWGPSFSPAGNPSETLRTFWGGITAPKYGLYGYLEATRTAVQIGTDSGCFLYRGPDTWLWLAQNDDNTLDNRGQWDIFVRHYAV